MTEFMKIIAETEGVRTPTRKRTQKEIDAAYTEHVEKQAKKRQSKAPAKAAKSAKERSASPKAEPAKGADIATPKPTTKVALAIVDAIPMNFISAEGYVREAAYDEKSKMFHIGFAKSTWAMPSSKKEWDDFEAAVADPAANIDAYYRKAFRGRTPDMIRVKEAK